jgi:septal ring factor EnvC (AmiA/AmiB activator)
MLNRTVTVLCILLLISATMGCTLFYAIDNSSPDEIRKFRSSKDELWDQAKALENEKAACEKQLADQQAELLQTHKDLSAQKDRMARADQQVSALHKTIGDLSAQLTQRREVETKPSPPPKETGLKRQPLTIKVLAGDGQKDSAAAMAKKLRGMGYRVARIDQAPRSDFKVHTVYCKPGRQKAAADLARKLGRGAVVRPLSWPSAFDIIVVTGQRG